MPAPPVGPVVGEEDADEEGEVVGDELGEVVGEELGDELGEEEALAVGLALAVEPVPSVVNAAAAVTVLIRPVLSSAATSKPYAVLGLSPLSVYEAVVAPTLATR